MPVICVLRDWGLKPEDEPTSELHLCTGKLICMAQLGKHLCRDSSLWPESTGEKCEPRDGGEQAGGEGEQVWVSVDSTPRS